MRKTRRAVCCIYQELTAKEVGLNIGVKKMNAMVENIRNK
jgi:hypothetical protein